MENTYWKNKRILITGGKGFVGKHLVPRVRMFNPKELIVPDSQEFDFRLPQDCAKAVKDCDVVIHLAANVGGIGYNQKFPGTLFYDNILMGVHLIEESRKANVTKFVSIGTICEYPKFTPTPFRERDLWNGYPEETNAPYGLAKKMMLVQGKAYKKQFGFNFIHLLPVNMYGPGDNFNPNSSHVIPALIRKFVMARESKSKKVDIWGTGLATREFLYVEDAVDGILLATQKYNSTEPVNLGSGIEISIKDLANKIKKLTNYKGFVTWDSSKLDGQPKRRLEVSKAKNKFGFIASTDFEEGLKQTIEYYEQKIKESDDAKEVYC